MGYSITRCKLLPQNAGTLGAVIELALKEENLMRRYHLQIGKENEHRFPIVEGEESMEVELFRPTMRRPEHILDKRATKTAVELTPWVWKHHSVSDAEVKGISLETILLIWGANRSQKIGDQATGDMIRVETVR